MFRSSALIFLTLNLQGLFSSELRFAVLGDRTGGHVEGVFEKALLKADMLDPEIMICVGDIIEGYSEDEGEIRSEWEEILPYIRGISCPFYFTPGNHDISNEIQAEIYRELIGEQDYSFDRNGYHFVILDNSRIEYPTDFTSKQMEWLEKDLKKSRDAEAIFVFYHKPFWFESILRGEVDPLHELFVEYGVDAVFTGHYHFYFTAEIDGIKYTGVGSSGAESHLGILGPNFHFLLVSAKEDSINISVIELEGVHSWDEIKMEDIQTADRAMENGIEIIRPARVDEDLKVFEQMVGVVVRNYSEDVKIEDVLKIDLPHGWSSSADEIPISLMPGDSTVFEVALNSTGSLYPLPVFSLNYPVRDGVVFQLRRTLRIQRSAVSSPAFQTAKIDGDIDESFWKCPQRNFFSSGGVVSETDYTEFYFAYDSDNLYLAAKCVFEDSSEIKAEEKERDGQIFSEDCVGYFFVLNPGGGEIYQVYFNPLGTIYDAVLKRDWSGSFQGDEERDFEIESYVKITENCWTLEAKLPLEQFEKISFSPGDSILLNFRRKQPSKTANADWLTPIEFDPSTFGVLFFGS
ncbi:metallophosphoesterase [candidate division WOR-3 bacterium]|nr:metallophosphoesterase [candidate division WOR-3 bacterium]